MEIFKRDIQTILTDLNNANFESRKQAIRDLAVSDYDNKLELLKDLVHSEYDIQLKYEIRKFINEIESLDSNVTKISSDRLVNLRRAFQSADIKIVNKAFKYAVDNQLDEFLPEMMMIENYTFDPKHRSFIVRLMHRSTGNYFKEIVEYLKDDDPRVIATAIEVLDEISNTTALASIAQLTEHPSNRVRATAIKALHKLGDEESFSLFAKMIQSPHSAYRDSAAYSLSKMCIPEGVKLLSILLLDEVESVRGKALSGLEAMAKANIDEAREVLRRLTEENPYGLWADKLIEFMLEGVNKSESENNEINENLLINPSATGLAALYSDSNELRMAAIKKLSNDRSVGESSKMIFERLKLEKDSRIIASALIALSKARGSVEERVQVLQTYLQHENERVRANAVEAIVKLTDPKDRVFLVKNLEDNNNRVLGNTIVALWNSYQHLAKKAFERLINSAELSYQLTAIYCIGELADWKLAKYCEKLLNSPFPQVREQMEFTIEQLRDISTYSKVLEDWKASYKEKDLV